jgi:hypothetical protein
MPSQGLVAAEIERHGIFRTKLTDVYFPLKYPALFFALAGVGFLKLGRFILRSAIIATAAVAALLGMAVIL